LFQDEEEKKVLLENVVTVKEQGCRVEFINWLLVWNNKYRQSVTSVEVKVKALIQSICVKLAVVKKLYEKDKYWKYILIKVTD
jgi:hypothetical protein